MNYYHDLELEECYDYLIQTLGREPTDEEIQNYIDELNALAEEKYQDDKENEIQGN